MKFNEKQLRTLWHNASKPQRELAAARAIEYEKRQVSNIDLSYRKAAVFLTGAALLTAGIANLKNNLHNVWPAAIAALITVVMTIMVILPKWSNVKSKRVEGIERALQQTPVHTEEDIFLQRTRHVYNLSRDVRQKRLYMYIAGIALILGVLFLLLAL